MSRFALPTLRLGETGSDLVFASGKEAEQVAVGYGAESFGAVAVVAEAAGGKDRRADLAVFGFKAICRRASSFPSISGCRGHSGLGCYRRTHAIQHDLLDTRN
jgi:hypothetical protein